MYEFRWRDAVITDEIQVMTEVGKVVVLQSRQGIMTGKHDNPAVSQEAWTDWQDVPYGGSDG